VNSLQYWKHGLSSDKNKSTLSIKGVIHWRFGNHLGKKPCEPRGWQPPGMPVSHIHQNFSKRQVRTHGHTFAYITAAWAHILSPLFSFASYGSIPLATWVSHVMGTCPQLGVIGAKQYMILSGTMGMKRVNLATNIITNATNTVGEFQKLTMEIPEINEYDSAENRSTSEGSDGISALWPYWSSVALLDFGIVYTKVANLATRM